MTRISQRPLRRESYLISLRDTFLHCAVFMMTNWLCGIAAIAISDASKSGPTDLREDLASWLMLFPRTVLPLLPVALIAPVLVHVIGRQGLPKLDRAKIRRFILEQAIFGVVGFTLLFLASKVSLRRGSPSDLLFDAIITSTVALIACQTAAFLLSGGRPDSGQPQSQD